GAAHHHVLAPHPLLHLAEDVRHHQEQLALGGRGLAGELESARLRLRHAPPTERITDAPLERLHGLSVQILRSIDDGLLDASMLPDDEHHDAGAHVDELDAEDRLLPHSGGNGQPRVLGHPGKQKGRALQHLLEVAHRLREEPRERATLRVAEPPARRKRVDIPAVPQIGRDPAGRGVGMGEVAELLERGHLVADRRGRDPQAGALGNRLAADRLARPDEILHDRAEHRRLPRTELGFNHTYIVSSPGGGVRASTLLAGPAQEAAASLGATAHRWRVSPRTSSFSSSIPRSVGARAPSRSSRSPPSRYASAASCATQLAGTPRRVRSRRNTSSRYASDGPRRSSPPTGARPDSTICRYCSG